MSRQENRELAAERLEKLRDILRNKRIVRVNELCAELDVSPATVRRDLRALEKRGHMQRVHGGAVAAESRLEEPMFEDKAAIAQREKQRIAQAALKYVKPNDSIFLDGGSTVLALGALLPDLKNITVVTNSLRVASTLAGKGPRIFLVGGELRRISQTFVGAMTEPLISQLHVDTAFMGTIGLTLKDGLTTTDPREAYTKNLIIGRARRVVLLADGSKIGKVSFVKFGALDAIHILITDTGAPATQLSKMRKKGIKIVAA